MPITTLSGNSAVIWLSNSGNCDATQNVFTVYEYYSVEFLKVCHVSHPKDVFS